MERARYHFERLIHDLISRVGLNLEKNNTSLIHDARDIDPGINKRWLLGQAGFAAILLIGMVVFVTKTSVKVHSESEDVKYKQESIFKGAGLSASVQSGTAEINPSPEGIDEFIQPVSMSYEVGEVTPTPTPHVDPGSVDIWLQLAQCESKQNWSIDTGNGYYGGLQFSLGAWASVGGQGKPSDASRDEQISRGKLLQAKRGWGPWGGCSKKLGLI